MPTRTAGALVASVVIGALLAVSSAAPAEAAKRDDDTCFGEMPTMPPVGPEDVVVGTEGDDVIIGGARVDGGAGDDLICNARYVRGGPGNDRIQLLNGGTASGNGGNDYFVSLTDDLTSVAQPILYGGPGKDVFFGGPLVEKVYGGAGADVARTGGGDDIVDLGSGDDQGYGGPGDDSVVAGLGNDFVDGGTEIDEVDGGPGKDRCRAVEDRTSCPTVR